MFDYRTYYSLEVWDWSSGYWDSIGYFFVLLCLLPLMIGEGLPCCLSFSGFADLLKVSHKNHYCCCLLTEMCFVREFYTHCSTYRPMSWNHEDPYIFSFISWITQGLGLLLPFGASLIGWKSFLDSWWEDCVVKNLEIISILVSKESRDQKVWKRATTIL